MGFDSLLGNDRLKQNLASAFARGHVSHFYLISGPEGSGKHTLARLLAAAILCEGTHRPCFTCPHCRKVMQGLHPDCITVDDPEKKTVTVDLVRSARADKYVQPNEADFKVYLFPRAQDMRLEGQNALLKILEEPPAYGVFLLLTDNPDKLLPTVRSRCTELKLQPLDEKTLSGELRRRFPQAQDRDLQAAQARSGGFLGQAIRLLEGSAEMPQQTKDFVKALCSRDELQLTGVLVSMEKRKRDELAEILQSWQQVLSQALVCRSGLAVVSPMARMLAEKRTSQDLKNALTAVNKALDYAQSNVSPGAICGWLAWELG